MTVSRYLDQFMKGSLAEAIDGGLSVYDDLADEIYALLENLYPHLSLDWLVELNRRRGFDLSKFEEKIQARAAAYAEAERENIGGYYAGYEHSVFIVWSENHCPRPNQEVSGPSRLHRLSLPPL